MLKREEAAKFRLKLLRAARARRRALRRAARARTDSLFAKAPEPLKHAYLKIRPYQGWIIGTAVIFLVGLIALSQLIGFLDCFSCKAPARAKSISDARTAILQIIVGAAGATALYFTCANYQLGFEGRKSDNFIKAVDQLGNSAVHTRVGGIYGLGRLLRTATLEGDYWPLMDVLTAFLREASPVGRDAHAPKTYEDLQAAINVLARRSHTFFSPREKDAPVDLSRSDLSGLWMANGHYEWGYFGDSLFDNTDLRGASLLKACFDRCNLKAAKFEGVSAEEGLFRWVTNADGASFKGASLTKSNFEGSNLLGADFEDAIVEGANFSRAVLAKGDAATILPDGVTRPSHWPSQMVA